MIVSLAGVWLNIKKLREGFLIWSFTNAMWAYIDFKSGLLAQGLLFSVYLILSIVGWFSWKKEDADVFMHNDNIFKVVRFMGGRWAIKIKKDIFSWKLIQHGDYCSCLSIPCDEILSFPTRKEAVDWIKNSIIIR